MRSDPVAAKRIPVSVLVVIFTDNAEFLLLKRRQPVRFWQSVTGSLEPGESPLEAACREIEEETGLTNQGELTDAGLTRTFTIDPRWRDRYEEGVTLNTEHEWHYRLPATLDIELCDDEHSEYRWFTFDDAMAAVWSWTNKEALQNLMAQLR